MIACILLIKNGRYECMTFFLKFLLNKRISIIVFISYSSIIKMCPINVTVQPLNFEPNKRSQNYTLNENLITYKITKLTLTIFGVGYNPLISFGYNTVLYSLDQPYSTSFLFVPHKIF